VDVSFVSPLGNDVGQNVHWLELTDDLSMLYVGGNMTAPHAGLTRLSVTTGAVDTGFNPGTGTGNATVYEGVKMPWDSGNVMIVGSFNSYNGTARNSIAKISALNGSLNSWTGGAGFGGAAKSLSYDPASSTFFGAGDFTSYNGQPANKFSAFGNSGSLPAGFTPHLLDTHTIWRVRAAR
jgi:hypothetical protein